jgi:hypothetical protein
MKIKERLDKEVKRIKKIITEDTVKTMINNNIIQHLYSTGKIDISNTSTRNEYIDVIFTSIVRDSYIVISHFFLQRSAFFWSDCRYCKKNYIRMNIIVLTLMASVENNMS